MLNGSKNAAKNAYDSFASADLKASQNTDGPDNFCVLPLQNAVVVSVNGICCIMRAEVGNEIKEFNICWDGDKIIGLTEVKL